MNQANETGPTAQATTQPTVLAGRAFRGAYSACSPGERAVLRRADEPMVIGAFWSCVDAARAAAAGHTLHARFIEVLAQLLPVCDDWAGADDDRDLGHFMRAHEGRLALRRVEALLGCTRPRELREHIESIAAITRRSAIDFGRLASDLNQFRLDASAVRRRWAAAYFDTFTA